MITALWLGLLAALCLLPPGVLTQQSGGTIDCLYDNTTNKVTIEMRIDRSLYPSECPTTTDGKPIFQSSPDGTLPFAKTECPVTSDIRTSACDFNVSGSDSCGCTGVNASYFSVDYQFQYTPGVNQWYTATIQCTHPTLLTQQITFPTCQLPPIPTTTPMPTTTTPMPTTTPNRTELLPMPTTTTPMPTTTTPMPTTTTPMPTTTTPMPTTTTPVPKTTTPMPTTTPDTTECARYQYGQNCQYRCGQCQDNDVCDASTGHCPRGCVDGFQCPRCDKCVRYRYGQDCQYRCGQCQDNDVCDASTGNCPRGCVDGFQGPRCDSQTSKVWYIWTSILATLGVVLLILLVVCICRKRRAARRSKADDTIGMESRNRTVEQGPSDHEGVKSPMNMPVNAGNGHPTPEGYINPVNAGQSSSPYDTARAYMNATENSHQCERL